MAQSLQQPPIMMNVGDFMPGPPPTPIMTPPVIPISAPIAIPSIVPIVPPPTSAIHSD